MPTRASGRCKAQRPTWCCAAEPPPPMAPDHRVVDPCPVSSRCTGVGDDCRRLRAPTARAAVHLCLPTACRGWATGCWIDNGCAEWRWEGCAGTSRCTAVAGEGHLQKAQECDLANTKHRKPSDQQTPRSYQRCITCSQHLASCRPTSPLASHAEADMGEPVALPCSATGYTNYTGVLPAPGSCSGAAQG